MGGTSGSQPGPAEEQGYPEARYQQKYNCRDGYSISKEQTIGGAEPDIIITGQNL